MEKISPVLLCGGFGTRLWPLSRKNNPKQFIKFNNSDYSLFQKTLLRFVTLISKKIFFEDILIICNEEHRFHVIQQFEELRLKKIRIHILLENESKNTAPAATLAAMYIKNNNLPSKMIISPTDHDYKNGRKFKSILSSTLTRVDLKSIYIFGVKATTSNNNYGHILVNNSYKDLLKVESFIEKPNLTDSKKLINSDKYDCYFNAGIFCFDINVWLDCVKNFEPQLFKICTKMSIETSFDGLFNRFNKSDFKKIKTQSIDYAVMEKALSKNYQILLSSIDTSGWRDMGSFEELANDLKRDKNMNSSSGSVLFNNSYDNIVFTDNQMVMLSNVKELNVVQNGNLLLITKKNFKPLKNILGIVNKLKIINKYPYFEDNIIEPRPWGWYRTIKTGKGFKIKEIQVNPGMSLSMQRHNFRSEHWVVVSGIASVSLDNNKTIILRKNESFFIKKLQNHMLSNRHKKVLKIIEIQSGNYLEEDDIIRIKDLYGRA